MVRKELMLRLKLKSDFCTHDMVRIKIRLLSSLLILPILLLTWTCFFDIIVCVGILGDTSRHPPPLAANLFHLTALTFPANSSAFHLDSYASSILSSFKKHPTLLMSSCGSSSESRLSLLLPNFSAPLCASLFLRPLRP